MTLPRPFVTLHVAQTLDGRIAVAGARVAISTREGLEEAHRARASHDAILVGGKTVSIDDPLLTVRFCEGPQPIRVVLASSLDLPETARLLDRAGTSAGPVLVVGAEGRASDAARARLVSRGAEVCVVPANARGWVSLPHALSVLYARGVRRLLVEGGARVLTSFLSERLADYAEIEIAPRIFGDAALAAFGALANDLPRAAIAIRRPTVEHLGDNLILRGPVEYPG